MGSTGYTCIRQTFCWLNILLLICGCAFLGAGLWLHLSYQGYATLLPQHAALSADSLFLTVGALSFGITFFGCCGSWFQSRCLLITYFTLLVLLFITEFLLGALIFVFRGGISRTLSNELKFGIEKHYNVTDLGGTITPSVSSIWNTVQTNLHCCGVQSYEDWYEINEWPSDRWVPKSCCRPIIQTQYEGSGDLGLSNVDCTRSQDPKLWWDKGCAEALQMWFINRLHIVGAVGLAIAFLQLFGLIISMLLFCTMKQNKASSTNTTYESYSIDSSTNQRHRAANGYVDSTL